MADVFEHLWRIEEKVDSITAKKQSDSPKDDSSDPSTPGSNLRVPLMKQIVDPGQTQSSTSDMYETFLTVMNKLGNITKDDEDQIILNSLPLKSYEEFEQFENKLKNSKQLQKSVVNIWIALGGSNYKALTMNILRRTLSDELAVKFSYTGKKGKIEELTLPFSKTQMCRLIHASVKKVFVEAGGTEEAIKRVIMGFLNQAKTRIIRRGQNKNQILETSSLVNEDFL